MSAKKKIILLKKKLRGGKPRSECANEPRQLETLIKVHCSDPTVLAIPYRHVSLMHGRRCLSSATQSDSLIKNVNIAVARLRTRIKRVVYVYSSPHPRWINALDSREIHLIVVSSLGCRRCVDVIGNAALTRRSLTKDVYNRSPRTNLSDENLLAVPVSLYVRWRRNEENRVISETKEITC